MSGVGEALAIVGVVAGLIQAIDAGQNIVNRIKQRRLAHRAAGALPPSDQLEQTLADGKRDIQQLVEKGTRRFGNDFVLDETARMAIMEVTIQIQNALLLRLTEARADDDVIDFDECIDLSDKACNEALVALQELYKRKLDEDVAQKHRQKQVPLQPEPLPNLTITPVRSVQEVPPARQQQFTPPSSRGSDSRSRSPAFVQSPVDDPQVTPVKRSKTTPFGIFRSKNKSSDTNKPLPTIERISSASKDMPKQKSGSLPSKAEVEIPQRSRASSKTQTTSQTSVRPQQLPESSDSWRAEMSRASTARTTRAPTLASISTTMTSNISKFNGSCKYAYKFRETGLKSSLDPINPYHHKQDWHHRCRSSKCRFKIGAADNGRSQEFDNKVYMSHGVSYRKSLLAKSHVAYDEESDEFPYLCLVCVFLGRDSQIYDSTNSLFKHMSQHDEPDIGPENIPATGPLVFGATSIKAADEFDVMIMSPSSPKSLSPTVKAELLAAATQVVKPTEPQPRNTAAPMVPASSRSHVVEDEPHKNPWLDDWKDMSGGISMVNHFVPSTHRYGT